MKYLPKIYAKALAEVMSQKKLPEEQAKAIDNFLSLLKKNNDTAGLQNIAKLFEVFLRKETGQQKITFETAREIDPKKIQEFLVGLAGEENEIEKKINPDLIAGVKITVDDEKQLDFSLLAKLKELFSAIKKN